MAKQRPLATAARESLVGVIPLQNQAHEAGLKLLSSPALVGADRILAADLLGYIIATLFILRNIESLEQEKDDGHEPG